jgi:ice-binding like protein/Big-like domain-containing protein
MTSNSILRKSGAALLLLTLATACSGGGGSSGANSGAPAVQSNVPAAQATGVDVNASMSATFNQKMDSATLTTTTFTVTEGIAETPVPGTVVYADSTAVFWPAAHLDDNSDFTATITTGALNPAGIGLIVNHVWNFTTGNTMGPGQAVNLGKAGAFAILAKAAISTVPTSAITGDVGISPAAATGITGFDLTLDASNVFSTSAQITGRAFAADYAPPTPTNLTTAVLDMQTAFTDAAGRAPDVTELGAGNIGGMTLAPGVYKWSTGLLIPTDLTLNGGATDVWVFQIAQDLTLSSATNVVLAGGALPKNVFWQVTGLADLGTTSQFSGDILSATAITLHTGASVNGRLLAQTAVTLDGNSVVEPVQ